MTNFIKLSLVLIFFTFSSNLFAQFKFGHIDSQKLLTVLPEAKKAQEAIQNEAKSLEEQLELMQVEYNNKVNEYVENQKLKSGNPKKWADAVKIDKEKEIQSLQTRVKEFQMTAQQSLQKKRSQLFQPILQKVQKAIKDVGTENKFTYIFDINNVLFFSDQSTDVMPLVKKKLGLK